MNNVFLMFSYISIPVKIFYYLHFCTAKNFLIVIMHCYFDKINTNYVFGQEDMLTKIYIPKIGEFESKILNLKLQFEKNISFSRIKW